MMVPDLNQRYIKMNTNTVTKQWRVIVAFDINTVNQSDRKPLDEPGHV